MSHCNLVCYPPLPHLPQQNEIAGKFVQFRWQGQTYLLFATKEEHRFHNQMLARFMGEHDLPFHWVDNQTLSIDVDELEVVGGGRFRFDPVDNTLELWDNSQAYGRFDENGLVECINLADHPYAVTRVIIR